MTALLVFVVLAYLAATALVARWVSADEDARSVGDRRIALAAAVLAIAGHAGLHAAAWRDSGGPDLHFFAALSLVTLAMAALSTIAAWREQLQALGVIVYPLAAAMPALYHFYGHFLSNDLDWRLQLHALIALLAYATLSLSALLALMLWFQERGLRQRCIEGWLRALPPLIQLEQLLFRTVAVGFALLTLVLVTGLLFVHNLLTQHLWHKTVLSIASWAVFGWLLYGRWRHGWRGAHAVRLTLFAMGLLGLGFFGSKYVLELILHRTA
jgi:ABC-type uncharacterized transport system permease subunit